MEQVTLLAIVGIKDSRVGNLGGEIRNVNEWAKAHGLGEGLTLRSGRDIIEFRERRGHVVVRRGRGDPMPEKVSIGVAAKMVADLHGHGWKVVCSYQEGAA
jgi:hypothetical protein